MAVLVTGGAGFIGSHALIALLNSGLSVIVVDNLENSSRVALERVQQVTGRNLAFHRFDLQESDKLKQLFVKNNIDSVLHFAGLKEVAESVRYPLRYFERNVGTTLSLLQIMSAFEVKRLVFSSSAAVYGEGCPVPAKENSDTGKISSPYGESKATIERICRYLCESDGGWDIKLLRYFNPVGAHDSGLIGEDPKGVPSNLMPLVSRVAAGLIPRLSVLGNDYSTPDGTCYRDYIHVMDVAEGHVSALNLEKKGCSTYNLGTGSPSSVLEVVERFSRVNKVDIPLVFAPKRAGDVPLIYADPSKAKRELNWSAQRSLDDMVRDLWRWQVLNPHGYQ